MKKVTLFATFILALAMCAASTWAATKEKVLHSFSNGTDGVKPEAGLIFDAAGNLYGTTTIGGTYGRGTVFELTPTAGGGWTEQVLYSFCSQGFPCTDGDQPEAGLIFDAAGNLYGTTTIGGTYDYGTVFELTPTAGGSWTEQVLHTFGNGTDGALPMAGLIFDAAGNLYGTTNVGGTYPSEGTVFELTPDGTEMVLHSFGNGTDGFYPQAGLTFDAAGNLYGTTAEGGTYGLGGTVFELTPDGTEMVLHSFGNGLDGDHPVAGLIFDAAGNLYGTTYLGGTYNLGTVFELTSEGTETVLHSFNGTDGVDPQDGLIFDAAGNLYGTTTSDGAYGQGGTVFELTLDGTEKVLYSFCSQGFPCKDGDGPSGLVFDAAGNLYGTTNVGGTYNYGTAFELTPIHPCARCSHAVRP